jgi:hypothetical protein
VSQLVLVWVSGSGSGGRCYNRHLKPFGSEKPFLHTAGKQCEVALASQAEP